MNENLTLDASGQYRRDLGWKKTAKGYAQHRFYLGRDQHAATIAVARLEKLWHDIEARWERDRETMRPIWDETTLAMAKSIINDEQYTPVTPPVVRVPRNRTDELEFLGIWFAKLVKDFPGINLTVDDPVLKEEVANVASIFQEQADRLKPVKKSKETLHQALDAYKAWLHGRHLTPPEEGKAQRTSQTGMKQGERVDRLKQHVENMPLSSFRLKEIEDVVTFWANRPLTLANKPFSPITCKHQVRLWKHFILWLHKEPRFNWKRPVDLLWERVSILVHPHEVAARATPEQVDTYSKEELRILWEYGTELHRTLMALALNCGFGIGEIATLATKEVQGVFIKRIRWKSKVYGEWKLWPVTVGLIAKIKANGTKWLLVTENGKQLIEPTKSNFRGAYIPNRWSYLLKRIKKDYTDFRVLSFNKLRKTAGNLVRQFSDGEIAGIFLCHGQAVRTDDLADVYTNRPFAKVFEAQTGVWEFLKDIFDAEVVRESKISLGTIKKIRELHAQGVPAGEIAERCGVAESTVRARIKN